MTDLDVSDVMRIAQQAVREQSLPLDVVGVVGSAGGDYVEILVNIDGCAVEPCRFAIGAFRGESEATLLHELETQLRRHYEEHREEERPVRAQTGDTGETD
jgi:hypothetical protein